MTNPLSAVLNKLDSEWRCDDLSSEEATSAFRVVAMVAVAEHDAALVILQDADSAKPAESTDWEAFYRTLVQNLLDQQHYTTDGECLGYTRTYIRLARDYLRALDNKEEIK